MVHIIISALLICGMGLLTVTASQTTNISAHPGDNITLCWVITFGDGTNIEIKDLKRSPISEKYCPGNIFYKLTFIFGGIVVILIIIIPLTLFIVKIRKTQEKDADQQVTEHHEDPHSTLYAALRFSKQKPRRAARHAEDADVVYSAIVQQYGPLA
ncbi:hypothetical protein F2P79_007154 [Pimephales promelas]|nr:hypothetical protein F2P79_007154 [Pimephales promelas]